jgi:hypothetical protein
MQSRSRLNVLKMWQHGWPTHFANDRMRAIKAHDDAK